MSSNRPVVKTNENEKSSAAKLKKFGIIGINGENNCNSLGNNFTEIKSAVTVGRKIGGPGSCQQ